MTLRLALAGAATTLALALLPGLAGANQPGKVTEYQLPAGSQPRAIVNSGTGLWVALRGSNQVARFTVAGGLTPFPLPTVDAGIEDLSAGADGNIWFTEQTASKIGRVTLDGAISEFPTPTPNAQPTAITRGPDGNMWFVEATPPARLARITPLGTITEFPLPSGEANDVVTGPDSNLWYTAPHAGMIGRLDPKTGAASEFPAPGGPTALAIADNSSLWFTEQSGASLGRIASADGSITQVAVPSGASTDAITLADDGTAWFTEPNGHIGSVTKSSVVSEFPLPTQGSPQRITEGIDTAMWVPEPGVDRIARVTTASSADALPPPVLGKSFSATTFVGLVYVKRPHAKRFSLLGADGLLPIGTVLDVRKGTVQITATSGNGTYSGYFYKGEFQLAQRKRAGAPADLQLLGGKFRGCPAAVRPAAKARPIRRLWAETNGPFRVIGRFSSGTAHGTKWLTADSCGGTQTSVSSGSVLVRDFVKRRDTTLGPGNQYYAAARHG